MQFFQNVKNFVHSTNIITHRFFHNFARSKYAIFRRMLNHSDVQHTQIFKNKIAHSTNTMTQTVYIILLVRIMQFFE